MEKTQRVFTALRFDDTSIERIEEIQRRIGTLGLHGVPIPGSALHSTLYFLGNSDTKTCLAADQIAKDTSKTVTGLHLTADRITLFERARCLVLILKKEPALEESWRQHIERLRAAAIIQTDQPLLYTPHITLFRRVKLVDRTILDIPVSQLPLTVKDAVLYESILGMDKPTYLPWKDPSPR